MNQQAKALLCATGGVFLNATNFVTVKFALQSFDALTLSLVWKAFALIYSFLLLIPHHGLRHLQLHRKLWPAIFILSAATGIGTIAGWVGLDHLTPTLAAFIWRFMPLMVIILGVIFLKERLSPVEWIAVGVMILGGCVCVFSDWSLIWIGVLCTLLSSFLAALQYFIAKWKIKQLDARTLLFYRNLLGTLLIAAYILPQGPLNLQHANVYWIVLLLGAFLGPVLGVYLTYRSYKYWDLSYTAIVQSTEPIWVIILAYIFLHKIPQGREFFGGCLIIIGAVLLCGYPLITRCISKFTSPALPSNQ